MSPDSHAESRRSRPQAGFPVDSNESFRLAAGAQGGLYSCSAEGFVGRALIGIALSPSAGPGGEEAGVALQGGFAVASGASSGPFAAVRS